MTALSFAGKLIQEHNIYSAEIDKFRAYGLPFMDHLQRVSKESTFDSILFDLKHAPLYGKVTSEKC